MTPPIPKVQPGQGGPITNVTSQDVISGRGQKVENHRGNVNFNKIATEYCEEYFDDTTKRNEKPHVLDRLVGDIRRAGGRFIKKSKEHSEGTYIEIGDVKAWQSKSFFYKVHCYFLHYVC